MLKGGFILSLMLSALLLSGCDELLYADWSVDAGPREIIRGSGNVATQEMAVSDFQRVTLQGFGQVTITQGDEQALSVTTDDNIMPYIKAEVRGGTLTLGFDRDGRNLEFRPSDGIQFDLSVRDISKLRLSGAGDISADSLRAERLEIALSGAGNVSIGSLEADRLTVRLSGAGNVNLAGRVAEQGVFLSGAGDYRAADLESQTAHVELSGAGSAIVWASDTLNARATGAGAIEYYGSPQLTKKVSKVGRVVSLGDH
jgi:hypothetical protein